MELKLNKLTKYSTISLVYLILALGIVAYSLLNQSAIKLSKGTFINEPRPIPAFELTDQRGIQFTQNQLKNHWSLLFFGFSSCPMICPTVMHTLSQVYDLLGQSKKLDIIFISVDPERDSLSKLNKFLSKFNPKFIALRGPMPLINELQKKLGVTVSVAPMSHGMELILVNPKAEIQAYFNYPISSKDLVSDLQKII